MEVWKKSATDLVEVLPKHILPSNYGGDEKSIEELRGNSRKMSDIVLNL